MRFCLSNIKNLVLYFECVQQCRSPDTGHDPQKKRTDINIKIK